MDPDDPTPGAGIDSTVADEAPALRRDPIVLPPGRKVGRYELAQPLGRGGFGVVYAAHDPELDRKVAIKLVRPDVIDTAVASMIRARMQREAQAMARLAHPNVVAVHDVGTHGDSVFVAMELVVGTTLREWGATRSWRAIVGAYVQAARGLAAAHAVDVIHRDFKPDNVLVGTDGRARVLDFGLSRAASVEAAHRASRPAISDALATPITITGAVMGTPAYMSPEQHLGEPTTAATDQFSFCVALYEALYGVRPFAGDSMEALGIAIVEGRMRPPPADTDVPSALHDVIVRGLRREPAERHASMNAIVEALEAFTAEPAAPAAQPARSSTRRRTAIVVAVAACVAAAAIVASVLLTRTPRAPVRPTVVDGDFELGKLGRSDEGWRFNGVGYRVELAERDCRQGRACARIVRRPEVTLVGDEIADLSQGIDARHWRGSRLRYRLSVRTHAVDAAIVWLRIDRPNATGFMFDTGDTALRGTTGWTEVSIVADVASDATTIQLGVVQLGEGTTWVDAATVEPVGTDVPLSEPALGPALQNGGFEDGDLGGAPRGWVTSGWTSHRFDVRTSDDRPRSGARSLRIDRRGSLATEMPVIEQHIDASRFRGKQISISIFARADTGAARLELRVFDGDLETSFVSRPSPADAQGWIEHEAGAVIPMTARRIDVIVFAAGFQRLDLDDASLSAP